jgi:hypothetical protein
MGWTVYAQSKAELIPMYQKLNYLASSLAPDYSWGGYMRGNLARLTVGGYLYNQLGIIKSITYEVPTESTWEIGIDNTGEFDKEVEELPHMIKVTGFTFIPIENKIPEIRNRFIHLSTSTSNSSHYAGTYPTKGVKPEAPPLEIIKGSTPPVKSFIDGLDKNVNTTQTQDAAIAKGNSDVATRTNGEAVGINESANAAFDKTQKNKTQTNKAIGEKRYGDVVFELPNPG